MRDLGVTDTTELLSLYAVGMATGTLGGADKGMGQVIGDQISADGFRMRGITSGRVRRDGLFESMGFVLDNFNVQRTEVIRGPQSLLYGATSGSGVINNTTKLPVFGGRFVRLANQLEDTGTVRFTGDANFSTKIRGIPVALRLNAVTMDKRFWRDNLRAMTDGGAMAIALKPREWITVHAEYEHTMRESVVGKNASMVLQYGVPNPLNGKPLPVLLAEGDPVLRDVLDGRLNWDNINSFGGNIAGDIRDLRFQSVAAELRLAPWLAMKIQSGKSTCDFPLGLAQGGALYAPTAPQNPTGQWAASFLPTFFKQRKSEKVTRVTFAANVNTRKFGKHDIVLGAETSFRDETFWTGQFYAVDSAGNFIVNPALLNNGQLGRTIMPFQLIPIDLDHLGGRWNLHTKTIIADDGKTYVFGRTGVQNYVAPTPTNPFGFSPPGSAGFFNERREESVFGTLFSSWFGGRIDTLFGYRVSKINTDFRVNGLSTLVPAAYGSFYGAVYHLSKSWALFYGASESYAPPAGQQLDFYGNVIPNTVGLGDEAGVKFGNPEGRVSGSLALFRVRATPQSAQASPAIVALVDPNGLNGRGRHGGWVYPFDRKSTGLEVALTARPFKSLNLRFSYAHTDGNEGTDVVLPKLYNDQFNVNSAGQVTFTDGTVHTVLSNPFDPASPLIPLTAAMMRDPGSAYRAILDPSNGAITNLKALGLDAILPNGARIGTGNAGLPISAHQLGFDPPGGPTAIAKLGGDKTTEYPVDSFNLTANYRFSDGRLRGFGLGANINGRFNNRAYYYSNPATKERLLLMWKNVVLVNAFLSYERKLTRHITWSTHLNITNIFDTLELRRYPVINTGQINMAGYGTAPRNVIWTNTFSF